MIKRRDFLKGCGALGATLSLGTFACAQLKDASAKSVPQLRAAIAQSKLTSADFLAACLERVRQLDSRLHSIIELNPEALALAQAWDLSGSGGVLGGIPVLLKDNIATADQMTTSAGSAALAGSRYPVDSGVAQRLRKAGAILMGKANMSEWANFRGNNSTSGWSARGGQCRNPHALDRSPCGSSSGSAVAVAAGLVPLAIGTETVGSIVCPSGTCGIVGMKPTPGLVPASHIIPIATTWDTAGPMGRNVTDVAFLLGALAENDYVSSLRPGFLKGKRLGIARAYFGFDWRVDNLLETQIRLLEKLGATIVDPVVVPTWSKLGEAANEVMAYEFKHGLNEYLAGQTEDIGVRTLADVIAFNQEHPDLEKLSYFGQSVLLGAERKGGLHEEVYQQALRDVKRDSDMDKVFEDHRLDAVLGPTNGPAWMIDQVNGDHFEGGSASAAAVGGYPHITVPAGTIHELPVGLSFIGPRHSESHLLAMAYDYEQATLHRPEPRFISSLTP